MYWGTPIKYYIAILQQLEIWKVFETTLHLFSITGTLLGQHSLVALFRYRLHPLVVMILLQWFCKECGFGGSCSWDRTVARIDGHFGREGFCNRCRCQDFGLWTTPFTLFSVLMIFAVVGDNIARFWDNSLAGIADIEYLMYLVDPDCFAIWLNRKLWHCSTGCKISVT